MAEKATKSKTKTGEGELEVTVFVPRGPGREGDIKKATLLAASDQIPVRCLQRARHPSTVTRSPMLRGRRAGGPRLHR